MSEFIQELDVVAMSFVDDRFDLAECFSKFGHNHALKVEGSSSMNDYFKTMVAHERKNGEIASDSYHSKLSINAVFRSLFNK